jgi:tetratricopeptide (TPR) repeat protein
MSDQSKYFYRTGAYRVDPEQGLLLCDSKPKPPADVITRHWPTSSSLTCYAISMPVKEFQILHALCESDYLSKANLMQVILGHPPENKEEEERTKGNLFNYISRLNKVLTENDPQKRKYIVQRGGIYRLAVAVDKIPLNQPAERLHMLGQDLFQSFNTEGELTRARDCFLEACAEQAAACAAAAETYIWLSIFSWQAPQETLPKAMELAKEALKKDSQLGDAHAAYALAILFGERAWDEAKDEFERATEDESEIGYRGYALWLMARGDFRAALNNIDRALAVSESFLNKAVRLMILYISGDHLKLLEYASREFEGLRYIKVDAAMYVLGHVYQFLGRSGLAIEHIKKIEVRERKFLSLLALGYIYAVAGQKNEAVKLLKQLKELSTKRKKWVSPFHITLIEEALGNRNNAIRWFKKAIETRDPWALLLSDPRLGKLPDDPRFPSLAQKIKTRG